MDFKNTLIIMTSNVGSSVIEKGGGGLGFQLDNSEEDSSYNRIKVRVAPCAPPAGRAPVSCSVLATGRFLFLIPLSITAIRHQTKWVRPDVVSTVDLLLRHTDRSV